VFNKIIENQTILLDFIQTEFPKIIEDIFNTKLKANNLFYKFDLLDEIIKNKDVFSDFIETKLVNIIINKFNYQDLFSENKLLKLEDLKNGFIILNSQIESLKIKKLDLEINKNKLEKQIIKV